MVVLFNAVLAGVKNFEVPMAEVCSAFQGRNGLLPTSCPGSLQVHPTSAGYRVIAQGLKAVIPPSGAAAPWLQWWCSGICVSRPDHLRLTGVARPSARCSTWRR
jgi:hypothetical protein